MSAFEIIVFLEERLQLYFTRKGVQEGVNQFQESFFLGFDGCSQKGELLLKDREEFEVAEGSFEGIRRE